MKSLAFLLEIALAAKLVAAPARPNILFLDLTKVPAAR